MQAPDATGTKNITKPDVQDCSRYLILGPERQKKKKPKLKVAAVAQLADMNVKTHVHVPNTTWLCDIAQCLETTQLLPVGQLAHDFNKWAQNKLTAASVGRQFVR